MKITHRFQVTVYRCPNGGFNWYLQKWDGSVAYALGDSSGWVPTFRSGHAKSRPEADRLGRKAAEDYVWRLTHPGETVAEFEIDGEHDVGSA